MSSRIDEKLRLIAELDRSRLSLARDGEVALAEMDLASKVRRSWRSHTGAWVTGIAATGLILARLPFRSRCKKEGEAAKTRTSKAPWPAGLLMEMLKFSFLAAKPLLLAYATSKATKMAGRIQPAARRNSVR